MTALGQLAAPVMGDVCFGGVFACKEYTDADMGGALATNLTFSGWAANAAVRFDARPFGVLLHASGAETAATLPNATLYVDDNGAASTGGGYMVYQVLASSLATHTATISVEDSSTTDDGDFALLAGCTTGSIVVKAGVSGIVKTTSLAVKRYLRWQLALGTATSVTFALAFFRG